jgi:zinc transport system substrate-binding protein
MKLLLRIAGLGFRRCALQRTLGLVLLLLPGLVGGCRPAASSNEQIATATSYLESAALELLGGDQQVIRLAEPGTCPGHFDIRPSQAAALLRCRALLRFDFQSSLDRLLERAGTDSPFIVAVTLKRGLCEPASYLSACRQIADAFVAKGLLARTDAEARLQAVATRLNYLTQQTTNRVAQAGLRDLPVISSFRQKDFCEWLGLNVVATFHAADSASVAEINEAITAGELAQVKLVVANLPEGRRTADALAERLNARVAVFGNFPVPKRGRLAFDDLLAGNVETLLNAARP